MNTKTLFITLLAGLSLSFLAHAEPTVTTIADGLCNPTSISFSPEGELTVCDANGTVFVVDEDGEKKPYITDFDTEYWKSDDSGEKWYRVGPLSAIWLGETLAVTDAGKGDGNEPVLFFDGPGKASDGQATGTVGPTSDDEADKGEGNLTGLSASADGKTIYVAGQGYDGKSWLLTVDVDEKQLAPAMSADENGIETNSPMDTLVKPDGNVLALYSGAGGEVDGLVVEWDAETGKPVNQWNIPELVNPMGFASLGGDRYAMTENNWALTEVNKGRVAIVTLSADGSVTVEETGVELDGPVSCGICPNGVLHVTQIGPEFDGTAGSVVSITGIE